MLQERNQGGCHRDNLHRGNGDVVHLIGTGGGEFLAVAHGHRFPEDVAVFVHGHIPRSYAHIVLFVGGHIDRRAIEPDAAIFHREDRGGDEAVGINAGMGGQGANQTGVRAFWRFDRANPAMVAGVNVPHREARPLPGQTAGAEGTQTALVGQLRQRISLIHELGQLAGAEELLNRRHQGFRVDQRSGR